MEDAPSRAAERQGDSTATGGGEAQPGAPSARATAPGSGFLAEASRLLASSLDYETTLSTVAGLALPYLGAWCIVDVVEPDGALRRLAIVHPDPAKQVLVRKLEHSWPPEMEDVIGAPAVLRTHSPQVVPRVSDEDLARVAHGEENLAILRELGIGSLLTAPLIARGDVLGAITFVASGGGRPYGEADVGLAEDLAARCALAIDNARLYGEAQAARRIAEERAEEAEQKHGEIERLLESRARLIRGFSHDVKNPLTAAEGYAQLLEAEIHDPLTERQRAQIGRLRASLGAALELIDHLLHYAVSSAGQVSIERKPTDVGEIAREIAEEYRAQAEAAGLALAVEPPRELPAIHSDRDRIRQVLSNLLSNAIKYGGGRITVRTEVRSGGVAPGEGEWVAAEVEDTGPGIPEEKQHLVFREFVRLEPGAREGAGLGLSMSQRIAEALGGRITVESIAGEGATFALWLPLAREGGEERRGVDGGRAGSS
jgi:signal transduction histidine kinase